MLAHTIAMLSILTVALAASPLLMQAGANPMPIPTLEYRQEPGHLGAVASESEICSKIGIELLQAGGNAADAVS